MAKKGMKRPDVTGQNSRNTESPAPRQKVWHGNPYDSDLARDNLNQDIPYADLQDM